MKFECHASYSKTLTIELSDYQLKLYREAAIDVREDLLNSWIIDEFEEYGAFAENVDLDSHVFWDDSKLLETK